MIESKNFENKVLNAEEDNLLKQHHQAYIASIRRLEALNSEENADDILNTKAYLMNNQIKCFKYNYSLEKSV